MRKILVLLLLALVSCSKDDNSDIIENYQFQITQLNNQITQLNNQLTITASQINNLQSQVNTIPDLESTINDLNSQIVQFQNEIASLEDEINTFEGNYLISRETVTVVVNGGEKAIEELQFQIDMKNQEIANLETQIHNDIFSSCPYIDSDNIGTWTVSYTYPSYFQNESYNLYAESITNVTSSSSGGILIFNDLFGVGKHLSITLDLEKSQSVTANTQYLSQSMNYYEGYTNPYFEQRSNTYFFSCSGRYEIRLKQCVDQGCFGSGSDSLITFTKE